MQTIKLDIKVKKIDVVVKTGSTKKISIDLRYKVFGKWDKGDPGQQILLRSDGTNIQRKYTSDVTRNNLVLIDDLKGDQWEQGIQGMQGIQWDDGREVELGSIDLANMHDTDELMIILDMPLQKDVVVTNEVWVNVTNQLVLSELENLNDTILEMMSNLRFLSAIRWSLNSIRSEIVNSITVASGTISTVSNISSIGSYNAAPMIWSLQNNLFANAITNNIVF